MKKTHLSLEDRFTISQMLSQQSSFKQIADALNKNCSSISREIRNHLQLDAPADTDAPIMPALQTLSVFLCTQSFPTSRTHLPIQGYQEFLADADSTLSFRFPSPAPGESSE
ncbi:MULTISPECIES: helix-turn-helix domain-containing protein [Hungatella]|uniref:Helix-turn-helix domain-containing protein n=1 Tax=Hungatella hathewayi TaxID=154046 RepID=A0A374PBZ0_9FIRM|nr:helix-turn-helix domain-containing protein [Hungatella sp. L36]MBT9796756.1 helix-turn-helix domain-containing protein [Hungatella hathewayi]MUB62682.1 helix-turn-helix domain-containing protein [Hungatella hathewayi]RGJ06058.1 helix-turn-helix domain-containing protein [Hungatella hathewayi]RGY96980.1 helix-turn-helix domain-containing protein [Hungatella hathewayi]